ncbi:hypothetical protein ACHAQH_004958 [Verticillium albo-atrum]
MVSFIDVRCQVENTLTPEGDMHYDLGKGLQSLCGEAHGLSMGANNHDLGNALDAHVPLLDGPGT